MATIGRGLAVADLRGVKLSGFIAWLVWLVVHIFFLIGFRNRVLVLLKWMWSFLMFQPSTRVIIGVTPSRPERE
jgi:NADH dehydrogenase